MGMYGNMAYYAMRDELEKAHAQLAVQRPDIAAVAAAEEECDRLRKDHEVLLRELRLTQAENQKLRSILNAKGGE